MDIGHAEKVFWYFKISEQTYIKLTEPFLMGKIFFSYEEHP